MSDKKILIREEYLNGIKAHNRSLVEDKNNLINKLTEAEDKILQLNSKIETLHEENIKLKEEIKSQKNEEVQLNFTPEEEFESITEPQYEPKIEVQKKSNIANNIQTKENNSNIRFDEFPGEEIYQRIHVTPNEGKIIQELSTQPLDYMGLSLATNITKEQLRTHKKDLVKKGIPIMTQKVSGFPQRMYIKPDTLKRFQITISN